MDAQNKPTILNVYCYYLLEKGEFQNFLKSYSMSLLLT